MRLADEIKLATSLALLGPDGQPIYAAKKKKKKKHKHKRSGNIVNPSDYTEDEVDDLNSMMADSFDGHKAGKKPHAASYIDNLADALAMSWYKGYDAGSDGVVPTSKHKKAYRAAQARALEISRSTHKTSRKLMKAGSDYVTDPMRAKRAAKYEASKAFFNGFQSANKGSGKLKSWVAASDNPCDECDEADGEDPIDIDDSFQANGLDTPPGHLNCSCYILLHSGDDD